MHDDIGEIEPGQRRPGEIDPAEAARAQAQVVQRETGEVEAVELELLDPALPGDVVQTGPVERRLDLGRPWWQRSLDGHTRRLASSQVMMGG